LAMRIWSTSTVTLFVVALTLAATPTLGDILVMQDGSRVETEGAWEVRGNMVVFTLPNGTLSSVRKSEVDLDASAIATRKANEPEAEASETSADHTKEAVLVLTDADIPRATSDPGVEEGEESAAAEGEAAAAGATGAPGPPSAANSLVVTRWESVENPLIDGIEIFGTLANQAGVPMSGISLLVRVPDGEGGVLVEVGARLSARTLPNGGSTSFRALVRGTTSLPEDPEFVSSASELAARLPQEPRDQGQEDPDA
ncbi:MAG: hypothetical protein AAGD38_21755, partial [Acidobacteriota bacterium]